MATLVYLESPFAGDVERNTKYARACMLDSLKRGEAPFVSHLLYTQVLDDTDPLQRTTGIMAGFDWAAVATKTVVYTDLGVSGGMRAGLADATRRGRDIEFRTLGGDWANRS